MKRNFGQKVALFVAGACAVLTLPAFAGFLWMWRERGGFDSWVPSMLAVVMFLPACAVVLYFISRPKRPLPPDAAAGH